jgi:hypothetical protein
MSGRPERPGVADQFAYDLRRQSRDLCMRIEHPDYVITPSKSEVFVVPTALIQRALARGPTA